MLDGLAGWLRRHQREAPSGGPPTIVTNPGDDEDYRGSSATLTVTAQGGSPLSYQWYKNGKPIQNYVVKGSGLSRQHSISGATTASLTIANLVLGDAGSYTVSDEQARIGDEHAGTTFGHAAVQGHAMPVSGAGQPHLL